ncbi:hypothetical protein B296_00006037 [Ensete ventricosum]|uniref:Uncharacterized protein n=1 Tax=Ensete ventricosum TaxID=4639 RepID=A0A426ZL33_ENSVE|nr:hypothetical protein B296_00006037 [Ensete ventricosum]
MLPSRPPPIPLNSTRTEIFRQIWEKGLLKTPNQMKTIPERCDKRRYCRSTGNMATTRRNVVTCKVKLKTSSGMGTCVAMFATNLSSPIVGPLETPYSGLLHFVRHLIIVYGRYLKLLIVGQPLRSLERGSTAEVHRLTDQFRSCIITKVPLSENSQADALARLMSSRGTGE